MQSGLAAAAAGRGWHLEAASGQARGAAGPGRGCPRWLATQLTTRAGCASYTPTGGVAAVDGAACGQGGGVGVNTATKIERTRRDDGSAGATWNPVTGCSKVSAGCDQLLRPDAGRSAQGHGAVEIPD